MKRTRIDSNARTPGPAQPACPTSELPALARMERRVAQGYSPNVIEMMSILEEVVRFSTEADMNSGTGSAEQHFMSGNKCPFCD